MAKNRDETEPYSEPGIPLDQYLGYSQNFPDSASASQPFPNIAPMHVVGLQNVSPYPRPVRTESPNVWACPPTPSNYLGLPVGQNSGFNMQLMQNMQNNAQNMQDQLIAQNAQVSQEFANMQNKSGVPNYDEIEPDSSGQLPLQLNEGHTLLKNNMEQTIPDRSEYNPENLHRSDSENQLMNIPLYQDQTFPALSTSNLPTTRFDMSTNSEMFNNEYADNGNETNAGSGSSHNGLPTTPDNRHRNQNISDYRIAEDKDYDANDSLATYNTSQSYENNEHQSNNGNQQPFQPPLRKKVGHRNLFIRRDESVISAEKHEELSKIEPPVLASGSEHYIVNEQLEYFDPRNDSNRDMLLANLVELKDLPPSGSEEAGKQTEYSTELLTCYYNPFLTKATGNPQYWVMSMIMECVDLRSCDELLLQGKIQHTIRVLHTRRTLLVDRLLLTLLRLVSGSEKYVYLLKPLAPWIFDLVCTCLWRSNELFKTSILRREYSDSRVYSCFLVVAFAAHTRPLIDAVDMHNPREAAMHKNHIRVIFQKYTDLFSTRPRDYATQLPEYIRGYDETFTTHDMAIEVFLELVHHDILAGFVPRFTEKFAKLVKPLVEKPFLDPVNLRLYYLVLKKPKMLGTRLSYPLAHYRWLYAYVRHAMDQLLSSNSSTAADFSGLRYSILCLRTLIAMQRWPLKYTTAYVEFSNFICQSGVINRFTSFVLSDFENMDFSENSQFYQFYTAAWTFLWGVDKFPLQDFIAILAIGTSVYGDPPLGATDDDDEDQFDVDVHGYTRGSAAVFIAVQVLFNKVPIRRDQLLTVYDNIMSHAMAVIDPAVQNWYKQLLYRITLLLSYENINTELEASSGKDWDIGIEEAFLKYRFLD